MPKIFTKEQCENIVSFHSDWPGERGIIGDNEDRRIDTTHRQCMVYRPPSIEYIPNWVITNIFEKIHVANNEEFNFDLGKENIDLNLLKYDAGGHFDTHMDLGEGDASALRKISFTLLLNDSYEGGRLTFNLIPEISQRNSEIGDMIIFPSYLEHRVEPITSGVRWALVGWILGDKHFV